MFVFSQGATKNELIAKVEATGVESLTIYEAKRLKRLVVLEEIKENNALSAGNK